MKVDSKKLAAHNKLRVKFKKFCYGSTIKPVPCICGGNTCLCEDGGYYRIHCMTCDWSFGGSNLESNLNGTHVVKQWNKVMERASK